MFNPPFIPGLPLRRPGKARQALTILGLLPCHLMLSGTLLHSMYGMILTDNRRSLSEETLKRLNYIYLLQSASVAMMMFPFDKLK